jgi:hypothetical protein
MVKDPNQDGETPYELLEVNSDASLTQVNRALGKLLRKPAKRLKIPQQQEAQRKLSSGKDRVAVDVWFYDVAAPEEPPVEAPELEVALEEFLRVPLLGPEAWCSDLEGGGLPESLPEVRFQKKKLGDLKQYDGLDGVELLPEFDQ